MNIEAIAAAIVEATTEAIRDYDIITSIESIKDDTSRMIYDIIATA